MYLAALRELVGSELVGSELVGSELVGSELVELLFGFTCVTHLYTLFSIQHCCYCIILVTFFMPLPQVLRTSARQVKVIISRKPDKWENGE
jgi:hypothetical protein